MSSSPGTRVIGRYALDAQFACGGMASVHFGRLLGPAGFTKVVAVKRLHPHLAEDPEFSAMLVDEARLAGRIQHPNVAATLDVVSQEGELLVIMEYVRGVSLEKLLARLRKQGGRVPVPVACAIVTGVLYGLHAAHEATGERGEPLGIIHRDVSPPNIIVGAAGIARVVDFGVAKASGRLQVTRPGQLKGKLGYMAPERSAICFAPSTSMPRRSCCECPRKAPLDGVDGGGSSRRSVKAASPVALRPSIPALDATCSRTRSSRHPFRDSA
jgi:serine/threonine-protein kinase